MVTGNTTLFIGHYDTDLRTYEAHAVYVRVRVRRTLYVRVDE